MIFDVVDVSDPTYVWDHFWNKPFRTHFWTQPLGAGGEEGGGASGVLIQLETIILSSSADTIHKLETQTLLTRSKSQDRREC